MATHGFGLVGCGMIAEFHTRAIQEILGSSVVAVFDTVPARASKLAELAGPGCTPYDDLDKMLAHPGLDVVSVCTPSGAHRDPAVKAANAGKHIVVEKPMEITLPRCDAILDACAKNRVRLCAIFPSRFSKANLALKEAIEQGRFGKLTMGDTYVKWWRSQEYYDSGGWRGTWQLDGGGALMNQSIHNVDLLIWLMGDVAEVVAYTALRCHERIEVEDTAVAIVKFQSGALGVIEGATSAYPGLLKRTEIHGENGSVRVEQDDITLWQFREPREGDDRMVAQGNALSGGASDPRDISHAGHREQIADFLHAIDTQGQPRVDGREGRKAVEVIRAIYRSARTGRPVVLPMRDDAPLGPP